jgi:hypothetical protein
MTGARTLVPQANDLFRVLAASEIDVIVELDRFHIPISSTDCLDRRFLRRVGIDMLH